MAGKIIADTIESASSQISLNVGNVTILTASSTGLTLIPTTNVNVNLTNSIVTLTAGSATSPGLTFSGNTRTGLFMPSANTLAFTAANTESMRIDSAGNVGIGTSSPNKKLEVLSAGEIIRATSSTAANDHLISVKNNSGTADCSTNIFFADRYAASSYVSSYIRGTTSGTSALIFATGGTNFTNIYDAGAPTERMRIDSSGNMGIGTTSPSGKLHVETAGPNYIYSRNGLAGAGIAGIICQNSSDTRGWQINGSNFDMYDHSAAVTRMRIDSSGNLLVNATQVSGERFGVNSGSNVLIAWLQQGTNTSGYNGMVIGLGSNGNNTSSSFLRGNTNTVGNWYLYGNGTTSFTSDQRLKKNIETTRNGYLEDLSKLRVVKYNWWKDDDNTPKEIGLIAQEVEQVFPGLVKDDDNPVSDNDDTVYKTLKQSVLPFMLLKAIQELKAIVDAQAVEIAALKAK